MTTPWTNPCNEIFLYDYTINSFLFTSYKPAKWGVKVVDLQTGDVEFYGPAYDDINYAYWLKDREEQYFIYHNIKNKIVSVEEV